MTPEQRREREARRSPESLRRAAAKRQQDPLQRMLARVRALVAAALRDGRLTRPDACEQCGIEGKPQAHHHDYSKPLEVEWLCERCHTNHHLAMRPEEGNIR
jgi:hypothetical protein